MGEKRVKEREGKRMTVRGRGNSWKEFTLREKKIENEFQNRQNWSVIKLSICMTFIVSWDKKEREREGKNK